MSIVFQKRKNCNYFDFAVKPIQCIATHIRQILLYLCTVDMQVIFKRKPIYKYQITVDQSHKFVNIPSLLYRRVCFYK